MQTFLPYSDFKQSAQCLDRQRLGKQRVECLQLIKAIVTKSGWANHPAAKMWSQFVPSLCAYGVAICDEWKSRGYKDTCRLKIRYQWASVLVNEPYNTKWEGDVTTVKFEPPKWLGDEAFHRSHRSNLLRKKPEHYGRLGWVESSDLPYIWPSAN